MPADLIVKDTRNGATTLTMNLPARLNGWTAEMIPKLQAALVCAAADDATKVVILTGADPYYCAGVNLGAAIRLGHPRKLHAFIVAYNQAVFDAFIDFPKPILVAVNGPAIGASVTSATLCDAIIASDKATFSTPFAALAVPPEGCSSVMFPRLLAGAAERMLGAEGWKPTAAQALEVGLVQWVVPHADLMTEAQRIAQEWIASGATRTYRDGASRSMLKSVNATESVQVASAFLSPPFLNGQFRFLWRKKKRRNALVFLGLRLTHPLWSRLL